MRYFLYLLTIVLAACHPFPKENHSSSSKPFPTPTHTHQHQFFTVDEVVNDLIQHASETNLKTLKATPKSDLIKFHHGFGTHIRNHYGLWQGNVSLIKDACHQQTCHPDTISMNIINALWDKLHTNDTH